MVKLYKWIFVLIVVGRVIVGVAIFQEEIAELWFVRVNIIDEELPNIIDSGQLINLGVNSWARFGSPSFEWEDVNCNGTFCPDPNQRKPSWFYINNSGAPTTCTLRVEASASGFTHSDEYRVTVRSIPQPRISVTPRRLEIALNAIGPFSIELNMPAENLTVTSNHNRVRIINLQLPRNCTSGQNVGSFDVQNVTGGGETIITVSAHEFPDAEVTVRALPALRFRTFPSTTDPLGSFTDTAPHLIPGSGNAMKFRITGPALSTNVTLTPSTADIRLDNESPGAVLNTPVTGTIAGVNYAEFTIEGITAPATYQITASATGFAPVTVSGQVCLALNEQGQCN
jgi:hypothetical protein